MAQRAGAICDARIKDAAIVGSRVVLRGAVEEHVHVGANVHVARLEGAGEGEDERDVLLLGQLLADDFDMRRRASREATAQRCVAVDIEFEEVEEGIVDKRDGAVDLALDAVAELERPVGFVADGEGNPVDLVLGVFEVFASFSAGEGVVSMLRRGPRGGFSRGFLAMTATYELRLMHSTGMRAP